MTSQSTSEYFAREAEIRRESAERSLKALIRDAEEALARVQRGSVQSSVGGSVLNGQYFQDAERNLVRYWDAATARAITETEEN